MSCITLPNNTFSTWWYFAAALLWKYLLGRLETFRIYITLVTVLLMNQMIVCLAIIMSYWDSLSPLCYFARRIKLSELFMLADGIR